MHIRRFHSSDADALATRSVAGDDLDVAARDLEDLGQDANEFRIRRPIHWWRIEPDQDRIVSDPGNAGPARSRDDPDVDDRAVR